MELTLPFDAPKGGSVTVEEGRDNEHVLTGEYCED